MDLLTDFMIITVLCLRRRKCGMHYKKKYNIEEARSKKYAISRYLRYHMVDDILVEAQSHELQKIAHEIISGGMLLNEWFQVAVIIDKLLPLWKDFKNILRHKTKEFSLESLITQLRIEEEARKHVQMEEEVNVIPKRSPLLSWNHNWSLNEKDEGSEQRSQKPKELSEIPIQKYGTNCVL